MELKNILEKIKNHWISNGQFELIVGLENAPQGVATGSEGLIMICQFIRQLKLNNEIAYNRRHYSIWKDLNWDTKWIQDFLDMVKIPWSGLQFSKTKNGSLVNKSNEEFTRTTENNTTRNSETNEPAHFDLPEPEGPKLNLINSTNIVQKIKEIQINNMNFPLVDLNYLDAVGIIRIEKENPAGGYLSHYYKDGMEITDSEAEKLINKFKNDNNIK